LTNRETQAKSRCANKGEPVDWHRLHKRTSRD
jgi:hypothetical protein